jgi:hypothetical protein
MWSSRWNDWQGKPNYSEKTCPSVASFTTNPTWLYLSSNQGRCGGKSAIFEVSQPYRPPRPVTGIALLFFLCCVIYSFCIAKSGWAVNPNLFESSKLLFLEDKFGSLCRSLLWYLYIVTCRYFIKKTIAMTQHLRHVARQDDTGTSRREHWFSHVLRNPKQCRKQPESIWNSTCSFTVVCSSTVMNYYMKLSP